jgi:hypothetical protein
LEASRIFRLKSSCGYWVKSRVKKEKSKCDGATGSNDGTGDGAGVADGVDSGDGRMAQLRAG